MTLCALDPEYPIEVGVADSPMFADLLTHWGGNSETVAELQGHLYQEVIEITRVQIRRIVFPPVPLIDVRPVATFSVSETGPMQAVKIDDFNEEDIDATVTFLDEAWIDEAKKRKKFHRTRLFFRLVGAAFREARTA